MMLDARVSAIQAHVYAESTKKTYSSYLSIYKKFCSLNLIPMVPISSRDLGRYIAFLSINYKYSSLVNYLSIVRLLHLEHGYPNPLESHYITNLKKGARRLLGDNISQKLPITPSILMAIYSQLSLSIPLHAVFWAACTVAFFSFFRKSNLLPHTVHSQAQTRFIIRKNVSFSYQGASISVNWSKTIQYQQKSLIIPLPFIPNSPLCPSSSLYKALKLVPSAPISTTPFLYTESSKVQVLTYSRFLALLKCCLSNLHIDSSKYSGHSFRRGGATFALESGVPPDLIKTQGDWKSSAYQLYLDPSVQSRVKVSHLMSRSILDLFPS